jgi:type VI secretion system secreted protein Hcp
MVTVARTTIALESVMAKGDIFLKVEGIEGESLDAKHKNEIQIGNYSFGAVNAGTGGTNLGSGAGKVSVHDIHCTKEVDKASPNLFISCCSGKHHPTAVITVRKSGEKPQDYMTITLSEVFLSAYSTSASEEGGIPMENFSLNFSKIKYDYKPQVADGTLGPVVSKTYDIKKNLVA